MKENISPEEKLLRLIRKEKKTSGLPGAVPPKDLRPKNRFQIQAGLQRLFAALHFHRIIWFVFGASCLYLLLAILYPWFGLKEIRLPKIAQREMVTPQLPKQEIKPFESYVEAVTNRQIFNSTTTAKQSTASLAEANIDITRDINLVGIIAEDNPQAIIEDKKNQKTYYVRKGEFIGEMQVEEILTGKVVINYKGQRFDLYL